MSDKCFIFKIITPHGAIGPLRCDSLKISITDGKQSGKGGSYGIRKGHAETLFALEEGTTQAFLDGKSVLFAQTSGGFAKISRDLVIIVVDSVTLTK